MADWIDNYKGFSIDDTEVDRLLRAYEMGSISKNYLLGLFGMSEKDFDHVIERDVEQVEVADG